VQCDFVVIAECDGKFRPERTRKEGFPERVLGNYKDAGRTSTVQFAARIPATPAPITIKKVRKSIATAILTTGRNKRMLSLRTCCNEGPAAKDETVRFH